MVKREVGVESVPRDLGGKELDRRLPGRDRALEKVQSAPGRARPSAPSRQ